MLINSEIDIGRVKSVNDVLPDKQGNVELLLSDFERPVVSSINGCEGSDTGEVQLTPADIGIEASAEAHTIKIGDDVFDVGGTVKTVNGAEPDESGNVEITASATPDNYINHNTLYGGRCLDDIISITDAVAEIRTYGFCSKIYVGDYWSKTINVITGYEYTKFTQKYIVVDIQQSQIILMKSFDSCAQFATNALTEKTSFETLNVANYFTKDIYLDDTLKVLKNTNIVKPEYIDAYKSIKTLTMQTSITFFKKATASTWVSYWFNIFGESAPNANEFVTIDYAGRCNLLVAQGKGDCANTKQWSAFKLNPNLIRSFPCGCACDLAPTADFKIMTVTNRLTAYYRDNTIPIFDLYETNYANQNKNVPQIYLLKTYCLG